MRNWQSVMEQLADMDRSICVKWFMSGGASFYFDLPHKSFIRDNSFTDDVEFPFRFDEIEKIEIPQKFGKVVLNDNIEEIAARLTQIAGLRVVIIDSVIGITFPDI